MHAGPERATATFWLLDAPDSLADQSHREPDGTGLGWYDAEHHPHVSKQPIAAFDDRQFAQRAHEIESQTFIAHIRFASTGALKVSNTHPFLQQDRLFAHNGVIEDLPALEAHLGESMSLVGGDTDSERLFALITRETAARDGDVTAGITAACEWVSANLPLFAINLILITSDQLWALRYPETHELYVLEREPGTALDHSSSHGTHVVSDHGVDKPMVVVASERMDDDKGWRLLASGELVHVDAGLNVTSQRILHGEPARLLTLDDLNDKARASQAASSGTGG